jgi:hypothetical protein
MLKAPYLRVLTPKTKNGVNLLYVGEGADRKVAYREDHLPLTARKHLEAENQFLPEDVRHVIEVVSEDNIPAIPVREKVDETRLIPLPEEQFQTFDPGKEDSNSKKQTKK